MFISRKRYEREKQELVEAGSRLNDAFLRHSPIGLFLLDGSNRALPQMSRSLETLLHNKDVTDASVENLLAPFVSAKTLSAVRLAMAALLKGAATDDPQLAALSNVELRFANASGPTGAANYAFEFDALEQPPDERLWLVRVTDITQRVQMTRELEDLRLRTALQNDVLRGVLRLGGARFAAFLQRTEASMKAINSVLKKTAREEDAFRHKLEETLGKVDQVRKDAAAFGFASLEHTARAFEDALHDLRNRPALSGGDFLPLAVKLEQFCSQFAAIREFTQACAPGAPSSETPPVKPEARASAASAERATAAAGSLEHTLLSITEHVAAEQDKTIALRCSGLQLVPAAYQAAIKNIAIQLIRNSVVHGIESTASRTAAGKPAHGSLQLELKMHADHSFELLYEDDGCGLDPDAVRSTAVSRGLITLEAAERLRDREAIKLIFKSGYTTLDAAPGSSSHGSGMSLVRRYVHEAGGKIALASLLGHETRFKITLPAESAAGSAVT